ncbi:hypothetical protein TNCV_220751 [Trichonephila clavipes]|nr:hypothetical protein TNCV_220751 [Trichonephila clavipes]
MGLEIWSYDGKVPAASEPVSAKELCLQSVREVLIVYRERITKQKTKYQSQVCDRYRLLNAYWERRISKVLQSN